MPGEMPKLLVGGQYRKTFLNIGTERMVRRKVLAKTELRRIC